MKNKGAMCSLCERDKACPYMMAKGELVTVPA